MGSSLLPSTAASEQSPALWGRPPEPSSGLCPVWLPGGEKEEHSRSWGSPGGLLSPQPLCSVERRDAASSPVICSPDTRWRSEHRETDSSWRGGSLHPCCAPALWMNGCDLGSWSTQHAPTPTSGAPAATCLQPYFRLQGLKARGVAEQVRCASVSLSHLLTSSPLLLRGHQSSLWIRRSKNISTGDSVLDGAMWKAAAHCKRLGDLQVAPSPLLCYANIGRIRCRPVAASSQVLDCAVSASSASCLPLRIPAACHLHYRMPVALSKELGAQAFPELRPPFLRPH